MGGQSITIGDIINRISKKGSLNLKLNQKADKSFINVQSFKAQSTFDWKREYNL